MAKRVLTQTTVLKNYWGGWISPLSGLQAIIPNASLEGVEGQYAWSNGVSLFNAERLGQLGPSTLFSAITDTGSYITDLPLNADMASNGKAFVVLNNDTLVRLSNDGTATEASYPITSPTAGQNRIADVVVLKDLAASPLEYALWSNEVVAGGDIALVKINTSGADGSPDQSFFSTTLGGGYLRKGVPHKLCIGADGAVYATDGSGTAQISITGAIGSASATKDRLKFGPGWTATGVALWKGYLVVIGVKTLNASAIATTRGNVRVWFWNFIDANYTSSIDIPDNYANAIFSDGTQLIALTNGRNNSSKIWTYNGTDFVKSFETQAIGTSVIPTQGNLEAYQDGLAIGVAYANLNPTVIGHVGRFFSKGYHEDAVISDGTNIASNVGMLKNLYQAMLFIGVSYGSTTYAIFKTNYNNYFIGGDLRTRLVEIPINATIKRFRIYFSQFGTGASVILSLHRGYTVAGISDSKDLLNKTITFANVGTSIAKVGNCYEFDKSIPNVSSWYMNIHFNHAAINSIAAIIERIEVDWTPNVLHSAYAGD